MAGIGRMRTIVLDCPDPQMLARFYGELLGWEVTYAGDDWVNLAGPGGKLSFQLAPGYVAPTWPGPKVPQQFHVDVTGEHLLRRFWLIALGCMQLGLVRQIGGADRLG